MRLPEARRSSQCVSLAAHRALFERFGFRPFGTEPMAIAMLAGFEAKVHMWAPVATT